jgi:hypothetical protein
VRALVQQPTEETAMLPNFLIIGAAKAGTTAVYHYLKQHPEICMSRHKETNFFALEGHSLDFQGPGDREYISRFSVTRIEDYEALFHGTEGKTAIGEASPMYLYDPGAPARIKGRIPDARLVAILRDPAERAFSMYSMFVRDRREPHRTSFARALAEEDRRLRDGWEWAWQYTRSGRYAEQLRRYLALFSREKIKIYLYEDLGRNPAAVMQDLFNFLGVNPNFSPDTSQRHNVSVVSRSEGLQEFIDQPHILKSIIAPLIPPRLCFYVKRKLAEFNQARPTLSPRMRRRLVEIYRKDIEELQTLIGRDLSAWLK